MLGIKFDEEKVCHCIQAYKDEHGKNPYLIMSEKTVKILPLSMQTTYISSSPISFSIGGQTSVDDNATKNKSWKNCKILIDNDIDFGEVYVR